MRWITAIILILATAFLFIQTQWFINRDSVKTHVSQDLKISFEYPNGWYITDKDYSLLITNYKHNPHSNYRPANNEIELQIHQEFLCSPTLIQDIIYSGCGEGKQVANKILEKVIKELPSGTFSNYLILYPQNNTKQRQYYLQKGDRVLQISKEPNSSQFEKEFEEIVKSIKFL